MSIRRVSNNISPSVNRKLQQLKSIPPKAYDFFKRTTPIRTGNARNKTNYNSKPNGGTIRSDYPYANRLNEGYSRQAPDGMTKPTISKIRQLVKRVL